MSLEQIERLRYVREVIEESLFTRYIQDGICLECGCVIADSPHGEECPVGKLLQALEYCCPLSQFADVEFQPWAAWQEMRPALSEEIEIDNA